MSVPARLSFVTLACRDVPAMKRFYDQFGWPPSEHNDDTFAAYQCGGAVLGLFGGEKYERSTAATRWRSITFTPSSSGSQV